MLQHCHSSPYEGYFSTSKIAAKILQVGFYWPNLYKDIRNFVLICNKCHKAGNISGRYEMPLHGILEVELFDVWGINFISPFRSSFGNKYIIISVDYVSKWVEAIASPKNDAKVVIKFFKKYIFTRSGMLKVIINDGEFTSAITNSKLY